MEWSSCLLQCDSWLPCITQRADAAGHVREIIPRESQNQEIRNGSTFPKMMFLYPFPVTSSAVGPDLNNILTLAQWRAVTFLLDTRS